jgi:signal transduction histidine kinase
MPQGGNLEIQSAQHYSNVQVTFSDSGEGVPLEILPKIFSPLITTKAQGMGFSLAISKHIIESHGAKSKWKVFQQKERHSKSLCLSNPKFNTQTKML